MSKNVLLVGHCGPDSSYLRMTIKKALGDVAILSADDSKELSKQLESSEFDLILFNRELGYGFDPSMGVEAIRSLRSSYPNTAMILVSNYPEAQQEAVAAGARPGFGKRELGTSRVNELLRDAVGSEIPK